MLIEQGAAGMAGKVPVYPFFNAGRSGHITDHLVAVTVVSDIGQGLQRTVSADDGHRLAAEDVCQWDAHEVAGLQLVNGKHAIPELRTPE